METKIILQNISKYIRLTEEEELYFLTLLKEKAFANKQFITQEGEIGRHINFVNKGCCKIFSIDSNGFEHILSFAPEDHWIGDIYSIITQKPGRLFIQAMEATEVLQLSKNDLDTLYVKVPKFERLFRILTENAYVEYQSRVIQSLGLTAKERYDIFNQKYARLKDKLPQNQIALYLGITPEFFSKMKKKDKMRT